MTLKEALKIVKEFNFKKRTVPTEASGCEQLFHYFSLDYHGVTFILSNDGENQNVWHGSIVDANVVFYTEFTFSGVIKSVKQGLWNGK